ncbi:MAG: alpha/beta fold hydrolase [Chthonomonadales bacterium]|nr:alpha/beta fold hydrolase [Chthonomonadales bacterium]
MLLKRVTIDAVGSRLAALHYRPEDARPGPCVVIAHGYTAAKESVDLLAAYLCVHGWHCVAFDFRGHKLGGSTGKMDQPSDAVADLDAAAAWALAETARGSCVLVGHSLGGLVAGAVGASRSEVAGVAVLASSASPLAGFHGPAGAALLRQRADYVEGTPAARFLEAVGSLAERIEALSSRPTLFVSARADMLAASRDVRELAARAGSGASVVEVDGGHMEVPARSRGVVAGWMDRSFANHPEETAALADNAW